MSFEVQRGEEQRHNSAVALHDIQATVLRYRPEPYFGSHLFLHINDAHGGREFLRRLTPHISSAYDWWNAEDPWIAVAISYPGLVALGLPEYSLQSFPEAFRVGMAARAEKLCDYGANDPKNWDRPFGSGQIHIQVSIISDTEEKWRSTMETARQQHQGFSGVTVLLIQDFGAQPHGRNSLGYKDSISQPAIEGSGVEPLPGQGPLIKAGEFILGYPGESGVPLAMPQPEVLGRNGTYVGLRKYQSRVGAFNRFLRENCQTDDERELLAAKLVGRWRSGAPLTLAPAECDDEEARGIYFLFISAKAMNTLEFLQQEWINNGNFMNLGNERDPLVGLQEEEAPFTIPKEPVRHRIHGIETFNVLRGGEYLFMPSLSALNWLASLNGDALESKGIFTHV